MKTSQKKIFITDRFSSEAFLTLDQQSFLNVSKKQFLNDEEIKSAHGLIIRSRTHIDEAFLKKAKNLQVIVTATSGFDHIDLDAAKKWGVTVMHTPYANVDSASQLTWALVLACASRLKKAQQLIQSEKWLRDEVLGTEISNKIYGIVGLGRIGKKVAQIAKAFNLQVIAYDPYIDDSVFTQNGVQKVSFEELLKTSDIVSFHVPKTQKTYKMLDKNHFESHLNRGCILVNTSRGSVIDEDELCNAVEQGWVAAAGLDVFEREPLPKNSSLLKFPEIILTPHIGANTTEAFAKASEQAALKIIQFFIDGSTTDTLPPKAAWHKS